MCDVTVTTTCDSTRVKARQIAVVSNVDIELSRLLHIEIVNIYHNAGSSLEEIEEPRAFVLWHRLTGQVKASSLEEDGGEEEEQEEVETHGVPGGGQAGTNTGMGLSLA